MNPAPLLTARLTLVPQTVAELRAMVEAMTPDVRVQVSPVWLERLYNDSVVDPWMLGFSLRLRENGAAIGQCGFKGAPDANGAVEIAYAVDAAFQGRGFATEAAAALTAFSFLRPHVKIVRAHTAERVNASTRVLTKCGFSLIGEVIDPEDGRVWRWEKRPL